MSYPKFRAVREERVSRAEIRRGIDKLRLQEAFDELDEEIAEIEALEASISEDREEAARLDRIDRETFEREMKEELLFRKEYPADRDSMGYLKRDYLFEDYSEDADFLSIDEWL